MRCSVVSKPKGNEETGRAHKGGHKKQLNEKINGRDGAPWARPVPGPKGKGQRPVCGGLGGPRVHKVTVSIDKRNRPPPCLPFHDDRGRAEVMEAAWSRGPPFERNR